MRQKNKKQKNNKIKLKFQKWLIQELSMTYPKNDRSKLWYDRDRDLDRSAISINYGDELGTSFAFNWATQSWFTKRNLIHLTTIYKSNTFVWIFYTINEIKILKMTYTRTFNFIFVVKR